MLEAEIACLYVDRPVNDARDPNRVLERTFGGANGPVLIQDDGSSNDSVKIDLRNQLRPMPGIRNQTLPMPRESPTRSAPRS